MLLVKEGKKAQPKEPLPSPSPEGPGVAWAAPEILATVLGLRFPPSRGVLGEVVLSGHLGGRDVPPSQSPGSPQRPRSESKSGRRNRPESWREWLESQGAEKIEGAGGEEPDPSGASRGPCATSLRPLCAGTGADATECHCSISDPPYSRRCPPLRPTPGGRREGQTCPDAAETAKRTGGHWLGKSAEAGEGLGCQCLYLDLGLASEAGGIRPESLNHGG